MAIKFDNAGRVGGFTAVLDGDFDMVLPTFTYASGYTSIFGANDAGTFLQLRGGVTRLRFGNGGTTFDLPTGDLIGVTVSDGRISRTNGVITFTLNGVTQTMNATQSLDIRNWGSHDGRSFFEGTMEGVATITGASNGFITHDFDSGSPGDTQLLNQSGDYDHGTLIGFTTGGFQPSNEEDTIANAGADESDIAAGDTVQLDGSASVNAVSYAWTETTSTGTALSDPNIVNPTFTAPSLGEQTDITFQLQTTGLNGSTSTDTVMFTVLADGQVPTTTLETVNMGAPAFPYNPDGLAPVSVPLNILVDGELQRNIDNQGWEVVGNVTAGNFTDTFNSAPNEFTVEYRMTENLSYTVTTQLIVVGFGVDCWGHSNMSGRGSSRSYNYAPSSSGTKAWMYGNNGVFEELDDPYDSHIGQVYGVSSDSSAEGSLVVYIATAWLEANPNIPIYFVPNAKGGSGMETWLPNSTDRVNGFNLYEAAMARRDEIAVNICLIFIGGVDYSSSGDAYTNELAGFGVLSQANWDVSGIKSVLITEPYYPERTQGDAYVGQDAISQAINDAPRFHTHVDYVTETIYPVDISEGNGGDNVHAKGGATLKDMADRIARSLIRGHSTSCLVKLAGLEPTDGVMNITLLDSSGNEVYNQPIIFHGGEAATAGLNLEQGEAVTGTVSDGTNTYQISGVVAGDVTEVVPNQAPTANAGTNQSVAAATQFTLDGTGSQDTDGTILEWRWTQTAGDTVTLNLEDPAQPTATSPSKTTAQRLTFELVTVDDEGAESNPGTVNIDVAAFEVSEMLKLLDTRQWTIVNDGSVQAFEGRSNREAFRFRVTPSDGIQTSDDGYFLFDQPGVQSVEIVSTPTSSISSTDDPYMIRGDVIAARIGDLETDEDGQLILTFVLYVTDDTNGLVMTAKVIEPYQKAAYFRKQS